MKQFGSHWADSLEIDISGFFERQSRKFKFASRLTRIMDTLHEALRTFLAVSRWILPRMIIFSDEIYEEIQKYIIKCTILKYKAFTIKPLEILHVSILSCGSSLGNVHNTTCIKCTLPVKQVKLYYNRLFSWSWCCSCVCLMRYSLWNGSYICKVF
jgi:hypothetical protein